MLLLQNNNLSFWILAFPDLKKPIGGIKQLHRVSEALCSLGFKSFLVQENADFKPDWFTSTVNTVSKSEWTSYNNLDPSSNVIILPETFIVGLTHNPDLLKPGIPKIVFNQNGSYTFGLNNTSFDVPEVVSLYKHPDIVQIWCVSSYDKRLLKNCFDLTNEVVQKIINPIDIDHGPGKSFVKKKQISFMPRKNSRHCSIVVSILKTRFPAWKFIPIINATHETVLQILDQSLGFLSFGHPEGFGLPVAEAMASACYVIGYSGLGGTELFELAAVNNCCNQIDFGDWSGFIESMENFDYRVNNKLDILTTNLVKNSRIISNKYSKNEFIGSVAQSIKYLFAHS